MIGFISVIINKSNVNVTTRAGGKIDENFLLVKYRYYNAFLSFMNYTYYIHVINTQIFILLVHQGGQKFPTREPTPGQPLFAVLLESSDLLQAGDHILYQSSKSPFRMMYRSALISEIQGTDGNLKVNVITNVPEIGVTQKQVYFDQLENLHKLEYDTCRYTSEESIKRARKRLKLKEKCYHALYNNSHFFVTWCKTSQEYPLTDILEEINQGNFVIVCTKASLIHCSEIYHNFTFLLTDPKVANKVNLPPLVYKTTVTSIEMINQVIM